MSERIVFGKGNDQAFLSEKDVGVILSEALSAWKVTGRRVLVIIPDGTRTGPIPLMFRHIHDILNGRVAALDFLIALGTHQPMSEDAINRLVGISAAERMDRYADVRIFNHRWDLSGTLQSVGTINAEETHALTGGMLSQAIDVRINRLITDYDHIVICGPVFPHEVAGFSGGNKYFFPGISGPEVINFTHWLGALITNYEIIGTKYTPVRAVIDRAASLIDRPKHAFCMVVKGNRLHGLFAGAPEDAWSRAADLSARVHVKYVDQPFKKIISVMPEIYDDLWTGAKGMYKMEPVAADGGEVIIYAPHISEVSYTHGSILDEVGYHVRDYFVKQWDRFKAYPWGVLAHSTHLKGSGTFEKGIERPRVEVTLATRISSERCRRINLGYQDPESIHLDEFYGREDEGILVVPHAGEVLYRLN